MDQIDPKVSGLDTEMFSAHSTKGVASTAAALAGLFPQQIMARVQGHAVSALLFTGS